MVRDRAGGRRAGAKWLPVRDLVLQVLTLLVIAAILSPIVLRCRQRLYIAGGKSYWDELDEPDPDRPIIGYRIRSCWAGRGVYEEQVAVTDSQGHFLFVSPPFWAAPGRKPLRFYALSEGEADAPPSPWAVRGGNGWMMRDTYEERVRHSEADARAAFAETVRLIRERRAEKLQARGWQ